MYQPSNYTKLSFWNVDSCGLNNSKTINHPSVITISSDGIDWPFPVISQSQAPGSPCPRPGVELDPSDPTPPIDASNEQRVPQDWERSSGRQARAIYTYKYMYIVCIYNPIEKSKVQCVKMHVYVYIYIIIYRRTNRCVECFTVKFKPEYGDWSPGCPLKQLVIKYDPFLAGKVSGTITQWATATSWWNQKASSALSWTVTSL